MRYLLHGDDTVSSRNLLNSLLEGYTATRLEGKSLLMRDLKDCLSSTSLFDEKKAVVIENLLTKNSKKKELVSFLNNQKDSVLLVLWEDKKLPKTTITPLKNVTVREFLLPSTYFQFLDNFSEHNGKKLFVMYQDLTKTVSAEQVFYSLMKRLRLLLILARKGTSSELSKMSPWQKQKLSQQVRFWSEKRLAEFYRELQDTEIKLKTGKLPLGLSKHLDTLILSQLS
jgi:DNA polymerase III delta subunit